ncbi:MAG: hypothetical protein LBK76_07080 [Verrucomicrobiales bacterium]|nr:hypothetical protein [Verrucomicrobiales bacterium]
MPRILRPAGPLQITEPAARRRRVDKSPITPPPACEQFVKKSPAAAAGPRPAKGARGRNKSSGNVNNLRYRVT